MTDREHDTGDGHFSTSEVEFMEQLALRTPVAGMEAREALEKIIHIAESRDMSVLDTISAMHQIAANSLAALPQRAFDNTAGWVLVPIEPTQEMLAAAEEGRHAYVGYCYRDAYKEMISAVSRPAQQTFDRNAVGNWTDLIRRAGQYDEHIMLPFNEYQIGNIVDALSQVQDNGDWWGEFLNMVCAAMDKFGIKELRSNNGRTFTRDQVWNRSIRPAVTRPQRCAECDCADDGENCNWIARP